MTSGNLPLSSVPSSGKGYGQPSTSSRGRGRDADADEKVGKLSKRFGGGAAPKKIGKLQC